MFRRILLTALIALGLGTGLWADDLHDTKSLLQARFPGKIQKLNDIRENTHLEFFRSLGKQNIVYVLGSAHSPGETFDASALEEAAENYIEGVSQTLPGMKILKKQKMQLKHSGLMGQAYVVQYDRGFQLHWVTVANNRLYMMNISTTELVQLKSPEVIAFLDSIKILPGKPAPATPSKASYYAKNQSQPNAR